LYITDWGSKPKVIRTDLDGQSPFELPIQVENPNGIALNGFDLYVVDSHLKSALIGANGTIVYGRLPSMIKYNTRYSNSTPPVDMVNIEVGKYMLLTLVSWLWWFTVILIINGGKQLTKFEAIGYYYIVQFFMKFPA